MASISCGAETDDILDSIFDICMDYTKTPQERKKKIYDDVVGKLVSSYNSADQISEFLDKEGGEEWERAQDEMRDRGSYGWARMVIQMIKNMREDN